MKRKFLGFEHEEDWKETFLPNFDPDIYKKEGINPWRITAFAVVTLIVFFSIFIRIFHLQIIKGEENKELADSNRIQIRLIHAPRGLIYDRNGKILASNSPGFRLKEGSKTTYISRDEALKMEAKSDPNLKDLEIDHIRSYPLSKITAHVLGYISEISAEELENFKDYEQSSTAYEQSSTAYEQSSTAYKIGDRVGRAGIEETYEKILRGVDGGEVVEVDASGKSIRILRQKEPIAGGNLYLTIDSSLQTVVFEKLQEATVKSGSCCGGAVVLDPQSGEILALSSIPEFDPEQIEAYLNASNSPMLNRVIGGTYPPGSTFKIASSLAGLSSGKITSKTIFEDTGQIFLGPYKFTNWYFNQYGRLEGSVDIIKAIKRSNDTFFYYMSQAIGEKVLADTAKKLGLGKKVGIDIPEEATGLIPDSEWKLKNKGQVWFPGDTLHMSIGQGFVLTTPLQILNLTAVVAAGGKYYKPHLALKITDVDGRTTKKFEYGGEKLGFESEDVQIIKKGLEEAAQAGGTAWPFFNFPIKTAGKTGTAEYGDPKNRTHAWYTAYAPADDPKIAAVVLIEGGGEGSSVASPVVKEIFRWFLSEDKSNLIKDIGGVATESARQLGE